jgi:hypothetical protein
MAVFTNGVVTHAGRVLSVSKREERVMSDVYADVTYADVVNDDGTCQEVQVRAHFECDTRIAYAVADASPEWRALAAAKAGLARAQYAVKDASKLVASAARPVPPSLPTIARGDLVEVTGKVAGLAKGDLLTVAWAGWSQYSGAARVGFAVGAGKVYCPASKVTRVCSTAELEAADLATERNRESAALNMAEATAALAAAETVYQAALAAVAPSMAEAA